MLVVGLIGFVALFVQPFRITPTEGIIFLLVSQFSPRIAILMNLKFRGFDVARKVNSIASAAILPEYKVAAGMPQPLLWYFCSSLVLKGVALCALLIYVQSPESLEAYVFARLGLAYLFASLFALSVEFFVWKKNENFFRRVPKRMLQEIMEEKGFAVQQVNKVVRRAGQEGLLHDTEEGMKA